jgi:hypothetical protein
MAKMLLRLAAAVVLAALSGCSTTANDEPERGGLLKTGGLMLGPNTGKDFLQLQGDGKAGL